MAITLVQSKVATGFANNIVVLDAAPTEGNLLVLQVANRSESTFGTLIAGWTEAERVTDGDIAGVFYHIAGAGESATVDFVSLLGNRNRMFITEWSGIAGYDSSEVMPSQFGQLSGSVTLTPTGAVEVLLLSSFMSQVNTGTGAFEPDAGYTAIDEGDSGGTGPSALSQYLVVPVTSGSYEATCVIHDPFVENTSAGILVAFSATPPEPPEIVPGPVFSVDGVAFDNLLEARVRFEHNAPGAGYMVLSKGDPQAIPSMVYRGAIVQATFPEIHADPLFEFYLEEGDFDVISGDEEGGEELRFGGPGTLSILRRAIVRSEEFLDGTGNWKPNRGVVVFDDGVTEGHILNKLIREAQAAARPAHPLYGMTRTFDSTDDSAGNPWDSEPLEGNWRVKIGSNLYDAAIRLVNSGLMHIEMQPGLVLDCWRNRGVDRSTHGSFTANNVRFVKGVNIVDELSKGLRGQHFATHAEVKYIDNDDDIHYINATKDAGDFSYDKEIYVEVEASHADTARRQAKHAMKLREDEQDAIEFAHVVPWPGDDTDELAGLYLPGPIWSDRGQYWLGDIITLDTASTSSEFDWNESDKRIYAITLYADATGYLAPPIVELNAPHRKHGSNNLTRGLSGTISDWPSGGGGGGGGGGLGGPLTGSIYQNLGEKGDPDGYAALDTSGYVPVAQLGAGSSGTGALVLHDDGTWQAADGSSGGAVEVVDPATGTITIDYATASTWDLVLSGDVDIDDVDNPPTTGLVGRLWIVVYGNGTDTVNSWPASFEWMDTDGSPTATPPTLYTAADSRSVVEAVTHDGGITWGAALVNAPSGATSELDDVGDVNAPSPANGDVLTWDSTPGEWVAAAPTGGSGGSLLALSSYAPSGDNTYTITATSDADVDATNVKVTFTAPASGNVLIKVSSLANDNVSNTHWTLRESTTTVADNYIASGFGKAIRTHADFYITGLSPGSSHTYKLGAYVNAGSTLIHYGSTSSKFGAILMEVWAA